MVRAGMPASIEPDGDGDARSLFHGMILQPGKRSGVDVGDLQARREAYSRVSTAMAYLDDAELRSAVLGAGSTARGGWGASHPAEIAGWRVFVKRVPLTEVERSHMFSTRNRFRLPSYYNYGVGSAGFGVFRELAGHIKTTNWVLEGAIESFPLLYHSRVMVRGSRSADPRFQLDDYVRRWNGSKAVANYMKAREQAGHELWLVLEHFPYTVATWLPANQGAVDRVIDQLCGTITFLRSHGIVHFDAHTWNAVGDGEQLYVTDFGLVLDSQFDLTDRERAFLKKHSHYDYGQAVASIGLLVLGMFRSLEPRERDRLGNEYGLMPGAAPHQVLRRLLERLDALLDDGVLPLEAELAGTLMRYREVILFMTTFLSELERNPRKNTRYDDGALQRLLASAGLLS